MTTRRRPLGGGLDGLNRYAYCHNNPVKYVDPSGHEIVSYDSSYNARLISYLNAASKDRYYFDKADVLHVDKTPGISQIARALDNGSEAYAEDIARAIKSDKTIELLISETHFKYRSDGTYDGQANVDEEYSGGVTDFTDRNRIRVIISGNPYDKGAIKDEKGNPLNYSPADILAHELDGHAIPFVLKEHGNAVVRENIIREERNQPLREQEPSHSSYPSGLDRDRRPWE